MTHRGYRGDHNRCAWGSVSSRTENLETGPERMDAAHVAAALPAPDLDSIRTTRPAANGRRNLPEPCHGPAKQAVHRPDDTSPPRRYARRAGDSLLPTGGAAAALPPTRHNSPVGDAAMKRTTRHTLSPGFVWPVGTASCATARLAARGPGSIEQKTRGGRTRQGGRRVRPPPPHTHLHCRPHITPTGPAGSSPGTPGTGGPSLSTTPRHPPAPECPVRAPCPGRTPRPHQCRKNHPPQEQFSICKNGSSGGTPHDRADDPLVGGRHLHPPNRTSLSTPTAAKHATAGRQQGTRWWSSAPCIAPSFDTVPIMGMSLHAPHPWPHITAALRGPGPRRVAIAYLDHTAPDLLPLRAGDQLIVNAARPAIRAHATSPTALAHFLENGV